MSIEIDKRLSLDNLRAKRPLIQCLTNEVAMNFCANVLNALGASPVMSFSPDEAAEFVDNADAITTNIGTLTREKYAGIQLVMERAKVLGKPVVFDPVAHFATSFRRNATKHLLELSPKVIRGNASEIIAFTAKTSAHGVDSHAEGESRFNAAIEAAKQTKGVIAMSGKTDFITDGKKHILVEGGHSLMSKVSASGCALTCVTGAFIALAPDQALKATVKAFATFSAAGAIAGHQAKGPGSFVPLFIDALAEMDDQMVDRSVSIRPWQNDGIAED